MVYLEMHLGKCKRSLPNTRVDGYPSHIVQDFGT